MGRSFSIWVTFHGTGPPCPNKPSKRHLGGDLLDKLGDIGIGELAALRMVTEAQASERMGDSNGFFMGFSMDFVDFGWVNLETMFFFIMI